MAIPPVQPHSIERSIIDVYDERPELAESTKRKVVRIAFTATGIFLTFATEIPSFLNAKGFDPFPDASVISAGAVVVYSFFGADNVVEMARELFPSNGDPHQQMTAGKVVRISFAFLVGIFAKLRGAGLTLHVAPGIANSLRIPLAAAKVLGTCWPEIFSVYSTISMKFERARLFFSATEREAFLMQVRDNLLGCLKGMKARIIQNAGGERTDLLQSLREISRGHESLVPTRLFEKVITELNRARCATRNHAIHSSTVAKVGLGSPTTVGTTASIILSTVLAKYADNTFFPGGDADWKWALAALSSLAIAYTAYTKSFEGAKNFLESITSVFGADQDKSVGSTMYPKSHALFTSVATFLVIALYGDHEQTVKGSIGTDNGLGKAVLAGIVFAAFFLYSQAMQGVFDKSARFIATSRYGSVENREMTEAIRKLEQVEKIINSKSLDAFEAMLHHMPFTEEQLDTLLRDIPLQTLETDAEAPVTELENCLSRLQIAEAGRVDIVPAGEMSSLLANDSDDEPD